MRIMNSDKMTKWLIKNSVKRADKEKKCYIVKTDNPKRSNEMCTAYRAVAEETGQTENEQENVSQTKDNRRKIQNTKMAERKITAVAVIEPER